jgi:hypothetical protein
MGSLGDRRIRFFRLQASGQLKTSVKSANKTVNARRAAENAGQNSRPLRTVKAFFIKARHS